MVADALVGHVSCAADDVLMFSVVAQHFLYGVCSTCSSVVTFNRFIIAR